MNLQNTVESKTRFEAFAADLATILGRKGREKQFVDYSRGLIVAPGRIIVRPMLKAHDAVGAALTWGKTYPDS